MVSADLYLKLMGPPNIGDIKLDEVDNLLEALNCLKNIHGTEKWKQAQINDSLFEEIWNSCTYFCGVD